jgi:hypothetical protein
MLLLRIRSVGGQQYHRAIMADSSLVWSPPIVCALERAGGARFYRCALQLNPFEYHGRHGTSPGFADEASYNEARTIPRRRGSKPESRLPIRAFSALPFRSDLF